MFPIELDGTIEEANSLRYRNTEIVTAYMEEKYHKVRIQRGIDLFVSCLRESYGTLQDLTILELAASSGLVSKQIQKKGLKVIASDVLKEPLEIARASGIETVEFDAAGSFPFQNESLEGVFAGDIIEHLFNTKLFLQECERVLKPNGVLLLTTPNLATLQDRITFLFGISPKQIDPLHEFYFLHIRPFTLSLLRKCLIQFGFSNIKHTSNCITIKTKKHTIIQSYLLGKIFPSLGRSLIVCCIKNGGD